MQYLGCLNLKLWVGFSRPPYTCRRVVLLNNEMLRKKRFCKWIIWWGKDICVEKIFHFVNTKCLEIFCLTAESLGRKSNTGKSANRLLSETYGHCVLRLETSFFYNIKHMSLLSVSWLFNRILVHMVVSSCKVLVSRAMLRWYGRSGWNPTLGTSM